MHAQKIHIIQCIQMDLESGYMYQETYTDGVIEQTLNLIL